MWMSLCGHRVTDRERLKPSEQIAITLAGLEAEEMFKPPGGKFRASYDLHHNLPQILRAHGTSEHELAGQALIERGRACAVARLRKRESKVRAVACHLAEHDYMDRVVFEALMKEN